MNFYKTENEKLTKQVVNHAFPPVIVSGEFTAGEGIIEAGTPLAFDAAGTYVPLDLEAVDTTKDVKGIATKDVDISIDGTIIGSVLRLGMVHKDALSDSSAEVLAALAEEKIFAS